MTALTELSDAELQDLVVQAGGKAFQARQVAHWLWKHGVTDYAQMRNVPARLRDALAAAHAVQASRVRHADLAEDGTEKLLVEFGDGETVECVIIPDGERTTLCISTQVGCPVGCVFCASGMFGVRRNLTAAEIAEQVLHARARLGEGRRLTNLVVMGMGEPMLNLDGLLPALRRIHDPDGIGMGARRITVSTSGYPRQMERFAAADPSYNLAVSLHAADDRLRKQLVPTATSPVAEIVAAAHRYFGQKGREVTYEVVLLDGKNDRPRDADAMIALLGQLPCTVNLIPWNPVEEIVAREGLRRPQTLRVDAFAAALRAGGLKVTVRRQRGADRSAACGQLRLRQSPPPAGAPAG
ncbi:MAG: 23S rRNA (adenine(2503)-C(2))-methyltransferase RlmN [Planctomycetes bacterium]|nr:23S rRNA (adenine(2503)-C(2))-methyltransferase RlmN [Planctomycetota bacterium]MCB9887085.1 23S rRNA (adenine(2503)-C(2))-methyltransferase RlmN [Planctomycetota bacterium]